MTLGPQPVNAAHVSGDSVSTPRLDAQEESLNRSNAMLPSGRLTAAAVGRLCVTVGRLGRRTHLTRGSCKSEAKGCWLLGGPRSMRVTSKVRATSAATSQERDRMRAEREQAREDVLARTEKWANFVESQRRGRSEHLERQLATECTPPSRAQTAPACSPWVPGL